MNVRVSSTQPLVCRARRHALPRAGTYLRLGARNTERILARLMNIGKQSGAVHRFHAEKMGMAVYLFDWCLWRQTKGSGLIYGGAPVTYAMIQKDTAFATRTLERWMSTLVQHKYVEVTYLNYCKMRIKVLNSKKFTARQSSIKWGSTPPEVADSKPPFSPPEVAEGFTKCGGLNTKCGGLKQSSRFEHETPEQNKNNTAPVALTTTLADWIPLDAWASYLRLRRQKRASVNPDAVDLLVRKLSEWRDDGQDVRAILENSVMNGYTGLFPQKGKPNAESFEERKRRREDDALGSLDAIALQVVQEVEKCLPDARGDTNASLVVRGSVRRPVA